MYGVAPFKGNEVEFVKAVENVIALPDEGLAVIPVGGVTDQA